MIGFDFLRPGLAFLPALAIPLFALGLWAFYRRRAQLRRLVVARQLTRFLPDRSPTRAFLRLVFASLALLLLGVAALGPVRGYTFRETARKGLDLVICLDTSRSMLARDLRPTRLERAKREIAGVLDRLRGDRCALVAFSGDARDVAPLTHDRGTLAQLLEYVTPDDNRLGGTDLAAAIEHGLSLFDGRTGAHEAIILLTDGEDLGGRGAELAETAKERGIRIYVVGVGTAGGGKIPVQLATGAESFLRGPDGEEVVTRLDGSTLQQLARSTGGEYLAAEQSPTPLEDLYERRIKRLEGREVEGGKRRVPYDRYQWPLVLALACMMVESGLRERSFLGRRRRNASSSGAGGDA